MCVFLVFGDLGIIELELEPFSSFSCFWLVVLLQRCVCDRVCVVCFTWVCLFGGCLLRLCVVWVVSGVVICSAVLGNFRLGSCCFCVCRGKVCGVSCIFHSVINVMGSLVRCSGSMECYLGLVFYLILTNTRAWCSSRNLHPCWQ